jgi:hypothetical protein
VRVQLRHHVELALGALEVAAEDVVGDRLEIPERLEEGDLQADVLGHHADVPGRAVEEQEVVLEQLDGVELGRRDRGELFLERAAQRDCGDGPAHRYLRTARSGA